MEIQLQELIDQIKKNGVEQAENEAEKIINSANEKAEEIIRDAQTKANSIITNAKNENQQIVKSSEDAIQQAGRNLLISFRESVERELNIILSQSVDNLYSSEALSKIIIDVIEGWTQKPDIDDLSVILNSDKLVLLENTILSGLKDRLISGITLKPNDNFNGGFRVLIENECAYYDYSTETVVDMLSNYLSPKIVKLLKEVE